MNLISHKEIIIDVGANFGGFSLEIAKRNPGLVVYAFEPEPSLAAGLSSVAKAAGITNHVVCDFALSDVDGEARFFTSDVSDRGTSSLFEFNEEVLVGDSYWSQRNDLMHSATITVKTSRLETFLQKVDFDSVGFIKIDAQGFDLKILESAGQFLSRIKAGMLEVPATLDKALYKNETDDLFVALRKLEVLGFVVYSIKPNDHASNEFNVFFRSPMVSQVEIEERYHLRRLPFYDGKNFWHLPSSKLEDVDNLYVAAINEVAGLKAEVIRLGDCLEGVKEEFQKLERAHLTLLNKWPIKAYRRFKLFLAWCVRH